MTRTSLIDNADFIVKIEGIDQIVGGDTQFTYGVANRFYAKRRSAVAGQAGQAREILDRRPASELLLQQAGGAGRSAVLHQQQRRRGQQFRADRLSVRAQPTTQFNATANAEFDSQYLALRQITVAGGYSWSTQLQSTLSWSKRGFIPELDGFNDPTQLNQSLNGSATMRTRDNKYGSIYSFNYDVLHSTMIHAADLGLLQRAVLRNRLRVSELPLRRRDDRQERAQVFHVVHARGPRQFLAVQRRARRRSPLDGARDADHGRRRVRRQSPSRSAQ